MAIYEDIVNGLNTRFATVINSRNVLAYEPDTVQEFPTISTIFYRFERLEKGTTIAFHYQMLHRLYVQRQDAKKSELNVMPYIVSIPAAVEADARLGGVLPRGQARIIRASGGYARMGGVVMRVVDFYSDVLYKKATDTSRFNT